MPTTRAMEAQFQTLLEKLTEMKSDLTASMNANMGEMKSELTASMNANMTEMKSELTANKEELKSDLKGIGDKLTTMDKKFEEMEGRIEYGEQTREIEAESHDWSRDEFKFQAPYSKPSIKLSTYDGKSSWQVYKTQFSIVADANQWDSQTKACQLAASLRADAADILQTLLETQRLDIDALANALELRFGEKCAKDYSRLQLKSRQQKVSETLQELATDVERLLTWRFLTVRLKGPSVCYEIRGSPASNTKGQTPPRAVNESDTSNSSVERLERQMRSFLNRVESLMSQKADGKKTLKMLDLRSRRASAEKLPARQGAETNSASQKEVSGKLINGHLVGRRLPDFESPIFKCVKFRQRVPVRMEFYNGTC
ncbi:retrovirus-related Pol polyprotein from transposon 412 [Trichonephila clavipes]|nr:retrovirus-related Pol polyprotein from transposon 412 [Trichonephila clavipes]